MVINNKKLGKFGEELVTIFLREKNYKILVRNFHSRYGEIDIIAQKFETLAFVEVKIRRKDAYISGRECVDIKKQRKILRTAAIFMQKYEFEIQPRFDVAEVLAEKNSKNFKINYIENAFYVEMEDESSAFF